MQSKKNYNEELTIEMYRTVSFENYFARFYYYNIGFFCTILQIFYICKNMPKKVSLSKMYKGFLINIITSAKFRQKLYVPFFQKIFFEKKIIVG